MTEALPEIVIPATDWEDDLALLDAQTELLLASVENLTVDQVAQASGLPGWSRGHVLAHIDGNAFGLARLARWARDGVERPMYISREVRDADVALHAGRSLSEHLSAITQSARGLRYDLGMLNSQQLSGEVMLGNGLLVSVSALARHRLQEVCVHHHDLRVADYSWQSWPTTMASHMTRLVARDFQSRGEFPVGAVTMVLEAEQSRETLPRERLVLTSATETLEGEPHELLAWLLGRSAGEGLHMTPDAPIPAAPTWR
jgi:maleylpyruvate isomerase